MLSEDCSRYVDSRQHKSGTFSSPNYPDSYPSDVVCQYTFQGHGRERVQIIFTDFRLRHQVFGDDVDTRKLVAYIDCSSARRQFSHKYDSSAVVRVSYELAVTSQQRAHAPADNKELTEVVGNW